MLFPLMLLPVSMPAAAQAGAVHAATTEPIGTCAALMTTYDGASKDMAGNFADSVGDNSAPRATLRAMEDSNSLAQARIALDLMRDNHCPLPKRAPAAAWYMSAALTCENDRLKASGTESPPSCDRSKWIRADQK
jgi:hypothetical protein